MLKMSDLNLDRRHVIAAGATTLWLGGVHPAWGRAAPATVSDSHAHLFNAADLPAVNFIRYVLIPQYAASLGPVGRALVDLVAKRLKALSRTAEWELAHLDTREDGAVSPSEFAAVVAGRVAEVRDGQEAVPSDLRRSYEALVAAVADYRDPTRQPGPVSNDQVAASFLELADSVEASGSIDAERASRLARGRNLRRARIEVWQVVGWVFLMIQSRRKHLQAYLKRYDDPAAPVKLLINHLVDYDRWLEEGPAEQSGHDIQMRFWEAYSARVRDRVDIHTFAGVCPLKMAEEHLDGAPRHFSMLKDAFARKAISGLKFYPVMGFYPIGNKGKPNSDYVGRNRIGELVTKRWRNRYAGKRIGDELDLRLHDLYRWCVEQDVPLMAHAGSGNGAGDNFGERANPQYWKLVMDWKDATGATPYRKLRFSIGHFVEDARVFTDEVLNDRLPQEWANLATKELLADYDNVYADLGFMNEVLEKPNGQKIADKFFEALKKYMQEVEKTSEPTYRKILYGTDWIMLGQIAGHERYYEVVRKGMKANHYPDQAVENICRLNARRFLKLA